MKYLKTLIFYIVIIEAIYLLATIIFSGSSAFLPITKFNAAPLYYDMDSLYGVTRQKNAKQIINRPWGGILHETNSLGFRDSEFNQNHTLVLGNSFIEGYGVNKADRFTELLERHTDVGMIDNAAFSGVWSPIQGIVLLDDLLKNKNMHYKNILFFITPTELMNIGKRNPKNDTNRNYPYKLKDSIHFFKASNSSFGNNISTLDKIKRFSKSLFLFKVYNSFKYYGAAKFTKNKMTFSEENLNWLIKIIKDRNYNTKINIIIINNLNRSQIINLEAFKPTKSCSNITIKTINFPNDLCYYFKANAHLNEKGHKKLAELLRPILRDE